VLLTTSHEKIVLNEVFGRRTNGPFGSMMSDLSDIERRRTSNPPSNPKSMPPQPEKSDATVFFFIDDMALENSVLSCLPIDSSPWVFSENEIW
jgi:hypothetical protein